LRRSTTICGLLLALAGLVTATAASATRTAARPSVATREAVVLYMRDIMRYSRETRYWQHVIGERLSPPPSEARGALAPTTLRRLDARWRHREQAVSRRAQHPPHRRAWMCIHRYEASWDDPLGPYYGGLQMDLSFQRAYGGWLLRRKGTADHWTPLEQIWTAEKAFTTRGFYPWPNTARACGLL